MQLLGLVVVALQNLLEVAPALADPVAQVADPAEDFLLKREILGRGGEGSLIPVKVSA